MVSINILFFLSKHKPSIYKALKAIRKILQETFYFWHCLQQPSRKFQQFHKDADTIIVGTACSEQAPRFDVYAVRRRAAVQWYTKATESLTRIHTRNDFVNSNAAAAEQSLHTQCLLRPPRLYGYTTHVLSLWNLRNYPRLCHDNNRSNIGSVGYIVVAVSRFVCKFVCRQGRGTSGVLGHPVCTDLVRRSLT